jgi:arsenate reductase (glutaredoxin)
VKLYHNARCSKSREACDLLTTSGKSFEIINYLKDPLTEDELKELVDLLGVNPYELVRKNEEIFVKKYKSKKANRVNWIKAMAKYPVLMQRPIVVSGNKAVVGRPPMLVLDL